MEADGSHLSANWLKPILDLLRDRDFGEAYALAEYFPATPGRKLVQCVALLCQDKLGDADGLLKTLSAKIRQLSPDFVRIHSEVDLETDLLEASRAAIKNKCLALSRLCLESHLLTHPESVQTVIDGLIAIVSQALITNNLDVGLACLDRVTELDDSPARLIQYAEIALANLQKSSAQALSKFVRDLINQALNRLPQEDVDNQLKIAKLLATIDVESFRTACKLLRQILHAHPSAGPEVAVLLLPLIDYLPYFSDIADFLLDVDPGNVAPLTEQLVKTYERSRNQSYLKKAQFLLNALDYVRLGYSSQLVTSLLIVGRKSNNFELYAQRLVGLELELDIALNVARILIRNRRTSDYDLVMWFLEQALQRGPAARTSVFPLYIRLSEVAASHNHLEQREEFLRRAVNLAMDLREFLELGGGNTPKQRLSTLFENIDVLSEALWFDQGKEADAFEPIIKEADQYERRQIFYTLLDKPFQIPLIRLKSLFRILFRTGLELTEYDVERIQSVMASLPYELQDVIQEGLSQQTIRKRDRLSSPGEGREERQREIVIENDRVIIKGSLVAGRALDGAGEKSLEILDVGGLAEMEKANQAEQSQHSTVNIERHTRIEFPTECVLERKVELRIQLTKDVPKLTRALRLVTFAVSEGTKQVTLDVHITAPGFAVQQWHKPLVLPINGNSEEIFFTLVPLEKGMQVIEIEFFHGSSRVGYVLVKTEVRDWRRPSTKAASNLMSMEDPVDGLKSVAATNTRPVKRTLHVSWIEREGKLYYTIYSEDPNEFGEWEHSSPNVQEQIADYLRDLNELLTEVVTQGNPTEELWESMYLNLQSVCEHLFTTLIPSPIAARIQKWEQGSPLVVSTNEQWIPWELMYDGQCFWGDKFIIARYPRLSDRRNVPDMNRPESKTLKHIRKIVNVVGGEVIPSEAQRAIQMFNMLPPSIVVLLKEEPVSVLQQALPGADALHCTCHGYLEPHLLRIAKDKSRIQNILPETIQKLSLEAGSLVFVNACASTAPVLTFGKFSSFGWEFYRRGVGVFVGTLGAVPTKYAISFAEAVYRELFRKDTEQTIGQAIASAKKAAANERNLFWLLYCIYGDPDFSIKTS